MIEAHQVSHPDPFHSLSLRPEAFSTSFSPDPEPQPPPTTSLGFHDNACSFHITGNRDLLFDLTPLTYPIKLRGLNGGVNLTHSCRFRCLPPDNGYDRGYFSTDLTITLLSGGQLLRCGGSYASSATRLGVDFFAPDGSLLDSPTQTSMGLLPLSSSLLNRTHFSSAPTAPAGRRLPPPTPRALTTHVNFEQRRRCDEVDILIRSLGYPSDTSLITDITTGKIPTHLTATDVHLNRLRGPCPHQLAGKAHNPPAPTSTSAPATSIGGNVSFDVQLILGHLPGAPGQEVIFHDELTGHMGSELATSKSTQSILDAIGRYEARTFTVNHHTLRNLHGDDEAVNRSLSVPLNARGISLTLSLPGRHAVAVERAIETIRSRSRSMQSGLPYILPLRFTHHLHLAAIHALNHSVSARSSPHTPEELVSGRKYRSVPIPFGSCHMVHQLPGKRQDIALALHSQIRYIPKTELGVCMGPDPLTRGYLFLTASGNIGPKVTLSHLSPSHIPFDWLPNPSFHPLLPFPKFAMAPPALAAPPQVIPSPAQLPLLPPAPLLPVLSENPLLESASTAPYHQTPLSSPPSSSYPPHNDVTIPTLTHPAAVPPLPLSTPSPTPPAPAPHPTPLPQLLPLAPTPTPFTRPHRAPTLPARFRALAALGNPYAPLYPDDDDDQSDGADINTTSALSRPLTITRKLDNQRRATARDSAFRRSLGRLSLNDKPSATQPNPPPPRRRTEVSTRVAVQKWGPELVRAAETKELTKILKTYKSFKPISPADASPDAIYLRSMALYKQKSDGSVAGRIPIDGSTQPPDSYTDTHAVTPDISDHLFVLSLVLRDAADKGYDEQLEFFSGDIPAAFINKNQLSDGSPMSRQFITRLPSDLLDRDLAGQLCAVVGAQYGAKQSNHIYDQDLNATMIHPDTGFRNAEPGLPSLHPRVYVKRAPYDPSVDTHPRYCIVIFYVDDFTVFCTCPTLKAEFIALIRDRYAHPDADVKFSFPTKDVIGLEYNRHENHSVTITVSKYIHKLLTTAGMEDVDPALTPSLPGLFHVDASSPLLPTAEAEHFRSINGSLIWPLPVRFDIAKEVRWLCSRNKAPTSQDRHKQIHVLRYLKGAPDIGPTYSGHTSGPPGIHLIGTSDVGHAVHPDSAASHICWNYSVGKPNAPWINTSYAQRGVIASNPSTAEYIGLSDMALHATFWRQFASSLGFPMTAPTVLRQDNNSAVNLAHAPEITRRSRFMNIQHHLVRSLRQAAVIDVQYLNTNDICDVDIQTKSPSSYSPNKFLYGRSILFNDAAVPVNVIV